MRILSLTFILLWLQSYSSLADVIHFPKTVKVFTNSDCQANDTCDLLDFRIEFNDYEVTLNNIGNNFGTRMFAAFRSKEKSDLENYGIVQYIKGCQFDSYDPQTHSPAFEFAYVRRYQNDVIPFQHTTFEIDSDDLDPLYNSADPSERRLYYYRSNKEKGSFERKTEVRFADHNPEDLPQSELYISDRPGQAFFTAEDAFAPASAKNLSLMFKVCLYKTQDIPGHFQRKGPILPNYISCHEWMSSFIYHWDKHLFVKENDIHPFCFTK